MIATNYDLTSDQSDQSIFHRDLIECTETAIEKGMPQTTMILLKRDVESSSLPPMELLRFNKNPSKTSSDFTQCFEE